MSNESAKINSIPVLFGHFIDEQTKVSNNISDNAWKILLEGKKVAIVHDWLTTHGGAEVVLSHLISLFPDCELYTMFDGLPVTQRDFLRGKTPIVSVLGKIPLISKIYRWMLPFMPIVVEQFDLTKYDIIISSSYAVAKGVITGPSQIHICYCHSPMRYAWDLQEQYLSSKTFFPVRMLSRIFLHYMRLWDIRSSFGVDYFISNSKFVSRRIQKVYNRTSEVIYPPININHLPFSSKKEEFYVTASRLVEYKRIDIIVQAFVKMPNRKLVVIGDGPERKKLMQIAKGSNNIRFLGYLPKEALNENLRKARAFIFAAEEDFGIAPLEAQACGTPVIAYGKGGVLETITHSKTGFLFKEQTVECLINAIDVFSELPTCIDSIDCRKNSSFFSAKRFESKIKLFFQKIIQLDENNLGINDRPLIHTENEMLQIEKLIND